MYASYTYDAAPRDLCAAGEHTWAIFDYAERYPAGVEVPPDIAAGYRLGLCVRCRTERLFPPGTLLSLAEIEDLEYGPRPRAVE